MMSSLTDRALNTSEEHLQHLNFVNIETKLMRFETEAQKVQAKSNSGILPWMPH